MHATLWQCYLYSWLCFPKLHASLAVQKVQASSSIVNSLKTKTTCNGNLKYHSTAVEQSKHPTHSHYWPETPTTAAQCQHTFVFHCYASVLYCVKINGSMNVDSISKKQKADKQRKEHKNTILSVGLPAKYVMHWVSYCSQCNQGVWVMLN